MKLFHCFGSFTVNAGHGATGCHLLKNPDFGQKWDKNSTFASKLWGDMDLLL
jgi:hypothetical protein